ncbi:hypothetical protein FB45DRAFT_1085484 [Roridomyces roridus]|uniref:Uncharacterized protein n=1 Tax=Roridomyces roridus TaxID=1738132 RepID=A0AAD7AXY3_9AGAR|nr:hypothetical protein FB45DRAFT_1085484 [Roridomyces roridus]
MAMRGRLSILKTLRIFSPAGGEMDARDVADAFAIAPNLTAVEAIFHRSGVGMRRSPFEFPWHQLTRVSTAFPSNAEALTTLEQLSSIVGLRVEFSASGESVALPRNFVTLPHLRVLEIMLDDPDSMSLNPLSYLLDSLSTPLLERLAIQGMADQGAVLRFVTRSGCAESLKTLHFIHFIAPNHILPILQKLPRLNDLTIGNFQGGLVTESSVSLVVNTLLSHWHVYVRSNPDAKRLSVKLVDSRRTEDSFVPAIQEADGLDISFDKSLYIDSLVQSRFKLRHLS